MKHNALLLLIPGLWLASLTSAVAFDTDPYTYAQAPDGTTSLQLYGAYRESSHFTFSGASTPYTQAGSAKESHIDEYLGFVHYTGFFDIGGVKVDPHVIIPYESANNPKLAGHSFDGSTGWGDPMLAVIIAPIHAPDNSQVLGIGLGEYIPVGQYEPGKLFTLGENRWKTVVQMDGIQQIIPQWFLAGSIDTTFYGDNTQGGTGKQLLTQQNSYQIQPWLRYAPIPAFSIALGYSQTYGGKQFLNNVQDGLDTDQRQIRVDLAAALAQNIFMGLQIGRDMAVDGGYRESISLLTRLTVLF